MSRVASTWKLGDKVKTSFVENVPEGADAERVIRNMAKSDYDLIFTTSFGYMNPTLKVASSSPRSPSSTPPVTSRRRTSAPI